MKHVSEVYRESMASQMRNRSRVRVLFSNADTTILSDGEWRSNGELSMSNTDTLDYGIDYGIPYATLELNQWVLDGGFDVAPEKDAVAGFVSSLISDEDGDVYPAATLTREFSKTHTIPRIEISFDTRTGIHPSSVTASFYNEGAVVKSIDASVQGDSVAMDADVAMCDKIVLTFGKMPPYRFPRIEGVVYGEQMVFTDTEIESAIQKHDVDPLSRRLPNETLQFTVLDFSHQYDPDNPTGIWQYIAEKSAIGIQHGYDLPDGTTEWIKADYYVLDSRPSFANNRATFKATGMVGRLVGTYYKGTLGEKNFYDMAVDVLRDADLPPLPDGSDPWVIDESLKTLYTTAAMPIDTHANCLQLIAHACCCEFRTDDDNIIHIEPFASLEESDMGNLVIDFNSIAQNGQTMSKIDPLMAVMVSKFSHATAAQTELYRETTTDTEIHVELSSAAAEISVSVSGGSVVSKNVYARAVDLVLSEGTKTITIIGKPITEQQTIYTLPVKSSGSIDVEKNPLITNHSMCVALADHVAEYLQYRNTYDVTYRGNPEMECGDVIGMQTAFTDLLKGLVLTDEITYNGALKGKAKIKAIGMTSGVLGSFILDVDVLS